MIDTSRASSLLVLAARRAGTLRKPHPIQSVADAHRAKFLVALTYAFALGRKAVREKKTSLAALAVRVALLDVLPKVLLDCLIGGGDIGAERLGRLKVAELRSAKKTSIAGSLHMRFDGTNPIAAKWAKQHAAKLAKDLSETTRQDIADAVARNAKGDINQREAYDEILDAVGNEARATLIARTETMRAANEGQRQAWGQAVEKGLLDPDSKRVWIVTEDDLLCPLCEPFDGVQTDLDGEYPDDGGEGPPLHPNCRCTEGIVS